MTVSNTQIAQDTYALDSAFLAAYYAAFSTHGVYSPTPQEATLWPAYLHAVKTLATDFGYHVTGADPAISNQLLKEISPLYLRLDTDIDHLKAGDYSVIPDVQHQVLGIIQDLGYHAV